MTAQYIGTQNRLAMKRFKSFVAAGSLTLDFSSIEYPNDTEFVRPDNGPWARVTLNSAGRNQIEKGNVKRFRQEMLMTIQLFNILGRGEDELLNDAQLIADHFTAVSESSNHYRTAEPVPVGRDGSWWQVNVEIVYYFDTFSNQGTAVPILAEMGEEGSVGVLVITWSKELTSATLSSAEFAAETTLASYAQNNGWAVGNKTIARLAVDDFGGPSNVCSFVNTSNELTDVDGNVITDFSGFPVSVAG